VEVKRIPGNSLPDEGGGPRPPLRRRKHIIWPWLSTVERAMKKASPRICRDYCVSRHYVVIVIPDSLNRRNKDRLSQHVSGAVLRFSQDAEVHPKTCVHIIEGPVILFDRL
jgi:hypothetical protein